MTSWFTINCCFNSKLYMRWCLGKTIGSHTWKAVNQSACRISCYGLHVILQSMGESEWCQDTKKQQMTLNWHNLGIKTQQHKADGNKRCIDHLGVCKQLWHVLWAEPTRWQKVTVLQLQSIEATEQQQKKNLNSDKRNQNREIQTWFSDFCSQNCDRNLWLRVIVRIARERKSYSSQW